MYKIDEIKMLRLGQRDENLARALTFDCSDWLEQYPEASIHILFRRPGESAIVPMSTTLEGATLTWLIHDFEVGKTGIGNAEFRAVDTAGLRRKSRIIPCSIEETLLGDDETVLYTQDQVDETLAHISEAAQAAQAAQASEEAAALSAQNATASATSASAAASVATSAKDAAQVAKIAAETAQGKAEAAQSGVHADAEAAEQAKVAAQAAQASAQGAASQASADRTAAASARADAEAAAEHAEAVVEGIDQAGAAQVAAVNAAGQAQVTAVDQAGTTQVGNVNAAGTTQVNAVQAKGTQVINSIPADYSQMSTDVTNLKSALDEYKDGFANLNIFGTAELLYEDGYATIYDGHISLKQPLSGLNAYLLPVDGTSVYSFVGCRFAFLLESDKYTAIGSLLQYVTQINSTGASYICFAVNYQTYPLNDYIVSKGDTLQTGFVLPNWFTDAEEDIDDAISTKIDKNGTGQVKPKNIEGVTVSGGNILNDAERLYSTQTGSPIDGYVSISNGTAFIQNESGFCSFLISVKPNTHYTANNSIRFAVLLKNLSTSGTRPVLYSTVVGSALANITSFDTGEADHIIISWYYNSFPIDNFIISEGNTPTADQTITLPDWLSGGSTPSAVEKPKFAVITGNIESGGNLQLTAPKNNLRKGERIVFEGNITSFESLRIGLTYGASLDGSQQRNTFLIDGTNISYYAANTSTPVTVAHGLTIENNIQIIWEMTATASVKFTLISNGNMFTHEFTNFTRQTIGNPFVLSSGTVLTDCKLTWTCVDIDKDIWMFGDSYFAYSSNRWTYYLHQYGYDQNCLLDGFPGEGGVNGRVAFNNLLQYGTPKYAVWCLGMNDRSDSNSAPSANWVSARDLFLQYCTNNGITPVFGTIPTVPTINHEQKNAWIRNSGYRYIDFAKAVGASASGVWYGNMLSSDGVHPSESGAKALFARVLVDFPEIMIDE